MLAFADVGALGALGLRLTLAALVLLALVRPSLRGHGVRGWLVVSGYGLAIGAMNAFFYLAIERIPLGVAATIDVLGPLCFSLAGDRRPLNWLWVGAAATGVVVLGGASPQPLDPLGLLFAGIAGLCWGIYIPFAARTARRFARMDGLALAMSVAALATLPFALTASAPFMLRIETIGMLLSVAILSSLVPYAAEFALLRRIAAPTLGVLMALVPVTAAAAGFLILDQTLGWVDGVAIAVVVCASAGAVLTSPRAGVDDPPGRP